MKSIKRFQQNCSLQLGLMRLAGRVSKRKIKECRAWRVRSLENIKRTAHAQGGNTRSLNVTSDQSDGLMTDWSHRHEQRDISLLGEQTLVQLRRQFISHLARGINAAHERERVLGQ